MFHVEVETQHSGKKSAKLKVQRELTLTVVLMEQKTTARAINAQLIHKKN